MSIRWRSLPRVAQKRDRRKCRAARMPARAGSYTHQYPRDGERFLVLIDNPTRIASGPFTGTTWPEAGARMGFEALIGKYAWVDEIEGWTVSVMRRRPADELAEIYGRGQDEPLGDVAFVDVDRHRGPDTSAVELFVQVAQRGEHSVTLERNGWSGAFPEIARRCSADGGWFFSVYWNIHAAGSSHRRSTGWSRPSSSLCIPLRRT